MSFFSNNPLPVTDEEIDRLQKAVKEKQTDIRKSQQAAQLNNQLKQLGGNGLNFDKEKIKKFAVGVVIAIVVVLVIIKIFT